MVRAEDQTIFGSVNEAKTAECRVCGKNLKFKDQSQEGTDIKVTQAKHCGTIYTIVQSGNTTISAVRDPKHVERENKLNEKRQQAISIDHGFGHHHSCASIRLFHHPFVE